MKKFNPVAIYNGQEEITREGKTILRKCIGHFDPVSNTLVVGFRMFESEFQRFLKVKENWFKYLTFENSRYINHDYLDEDGNPYENQEEWIREVYIAVSDSTITDIRDMCSCIAFGADKSKCSYSDYSDVFNKIFWPSDESILEIWNHFHRNAI